MDSILNVDDYTPGRYARTKVLRQAGFDVREAATGKEALQKALEYRSVHHSSGRESAGHERI